MSRSVTLRDLEKEKPRFVNRKGIQLPRESETESIMDKEDVEVVSEVVSEVVPEVVDKPRRGRPKRKK